MSERGDALRSALRQLAGGSDDRTCGGLREGVRRSSEVVSQRRRSDPSRMLPPQLGLSLDRGTALLRHLPTIPAQARQIAKATVPDLSESRWTNHAYALASMQLGPAQPEDAPSSSRLRRGGTSQSRQFEDKRRGNLPRCVAGRPSVGHIECRESAGLWDRCAQAVFRCCHFHGTTRRSRRTPILEVMTAQRGGFCASV